MRHCGAGAANVNILFEDLEMDHWLVGSDTIAEPVRSSGPGDRTFTGWRRRAAQPKRVSTSKRDAEDENAWTEHHGWARSELCPPPRRGNR